MATHPTGPPSFIQIRAQLLEISCYVSFLALSLIGEESLEKFLDPDPDSKIKSPKKKSPKLSVVVLRQSSTHTKKFQNNCLKTVAKNRVTNKETDRQTPQTNILGEKKFPPSNNVLE